MYEAPLVQQFDVRVGVPQQPIHSLVVVAEDSAAALLFILETAPQAFYVSVRPSCS